MVGRERWGRSVVFALALYALSSGASSANGQPAPGAAGPLLTVDTAIDGAAPAGTVDDSNRFQASTRPGIRIGDIIYRAPWMRSHGATGTYSGTSANGTDYAALWQLVAVDRRTGAVLWNRTYGSCRRNGGASICREGDDGEPDAVDPDQEMADLIDAANGNSGLVVASSHPSRSSPVGRLWGPPDDLSFATGSLKEIGVEFTVSLATANPGSVSVIGVAGIKLGAADLSVNFNGRGRMRGYFGYDVTTSRYDGFLPSQRPMFDTRSVNGCSGATCTMGQKVGDETASGTVPDGKAGYLVAAYDAHTLARQDAQTFITKGCGTVAQCSSAARAMTEFLERWTLSVLVVTALETPAQQPSPITVDPGIPQADWSALSKAIAGVGGTRHRFNTAAVRTNSEYTLIGWSAAGEGAGSEAMGGGSRLSGALIPDNHSLFRPTNVSSNGTAAERLTQLLVAPPSPGGGWPELPGGPDAQPGRHAAVQYIGSRIPQLGSDPRTAYWKQRVGTPTGPNVGTLKDDIDAVTMPTAKGKTQATGFNAADLSWAKGQMKKEIDWLASMRGYLATLAAPTSVATEHAWPDAKTLADDLKSQVATIDANAQMAFDVFGVVLGLLQFAGLPEAKEVGKLVKVLAGVTQFVKVCLNARYGTGAAPGEAVQIAADQLAQSLIDEAERTANAFLRMGDTIASDYAKLSEVGAWASCDPDSACPPGSPYEEYAITPAGVRIAATMASRALDRTIYEHLVPLGSAFPTWDTSVSSDPDPSKWFYCSDLYTPFKDAPADGWGRDKAPHFGASTIALDELDPGLHGFDAQNPTAPHSRWRSYILVHRKNETYGWPSQAILDRMFGPANTSEWNYSGGNPQDSSGLGISPQDFMRAALPKYEPGPNCYWVRPDGGFEPPPQ